MVDKIFDWLNKLSPIQIYVGIAALVALPFGIGIAIRNEILVGVVIFGAVFCLTLFYVILATTPGRAE